jgi:hypothetical protein
MCVQFITIHVLDHILHLEKYSMLIGKGCSRLVQKYSLTHGKSEDLLLNERVLSAYALAGEEEKQDN